MVNVGSEDGSDCLRLCYTKPDVSLPKSRKRVVQNLTSALFRLKGVGSAKRCNR